MLCSVVHTPSHSRHMPSSNLPTIPLGRPGLSTLLVLSLGKLPNCQHICDSLVSTPSKDMAVKIALVVLDRLESNLILAFWKKGQIKALTTIM